VDYVDWKIDDFKNKYLKLKQKKILESAEKKIHQAKEVQKVAEEVKVVEESSEEESEEEEKKVVE